MINLNTITIWVKSYFSPSNTHLSEGRSRSRRQAPADQCPNPTISPTPTTSHWVRRQWVPPRDKETIMQKNTRMWIRVRGPRIWAWCWKESDIDRDAVCSCKKKKKLNEIYVLSSICRFEELKKRQRKESEEVAWRSYAGAHFFDQALDIFRGLLQKVNDLNGKEE